MLFFPFGERALHERKRTNTEEEEVFKLLFPFNDENRWAFSIYYIRND